MKYDMCFGPHSRKPCEHYHPSNTPDYIGKQLDAFAYQRCWCMALNRPCFEVSGLCGENGIAEYDVKITVSGRISLHIADSVEDFARHLECLIDSSGFEAEPRVDFEFEKVIQEEEGAE